MLLENLSSQERQLYSLIGLGSAAALVLGLLGGLISFTWSNNERADNWQASEPAAVVDTLAEFTEVSTQPRWFNEAGPATAAQAAEAARKAIEGQPESMKLIGIVERNKRPYALFIPVDPNPTNNGTPKGVVQFGVGETLVGDWVVKEITAGTVVVETKKEGTETQTKELLLYAPKR